MYVVPRGESVSMGLGNRTRIALIGSSFYFFFPVIFKYSATAGIFLSIAHGQQQWVRAIYPGSGSSSSYGHPSLLGATVGRYLFLSTMPLIAVRISAKVFEYITRTISQRIDRWIPNTELAGIMSIAFVGVLMTLSEHRNREIVPIQDKCGINLSVGSRAIHGYHWKRSRSLLQKRKHRRALKSTTKTV
jgi:hypothetical protein